jgi:CBS domain-containing protein
MDVADICSEDVVTVYLDESLLDVADVLREERVGSAVVLDATGAVLGMVTDRDLIVYGRRFAPSLEGTTVNEILSKDVVSVTPDTSVSSLAETMRREGVRRVPVVEDGELRGIVTLDDVVVHLADVSDDEILENLAAVIENESPDRETP